MKDQANCSEKDKLQSNHLTSSANMSKSHKEVQSNITAAKTPYQDSVQTEKEHALQDI